MAEDRGWEWVDQYAEAILDEARSVGLI